MIVRDLQPSHIRSLIDAEALELRSKIWGLDRTKANLQASVDWLKHLVEHLPGDAAEKSTEQAPPASGPAPHG